MDNKQLSETEICDIYITPSLKQAGWEFVTQIRREYYFTDGRINVRGKIAWRGKRNFADYLLCFKPGLPLACVRKHAAEALISQVFS